MTNRQWILVLAAVGLGIVAQIPMRHDMDTSDAAGHHMAAPDSTSGMAVNAHPATAMADMPNGMAQVTFDITGMT